MKTMIMKKVLIILILITYSGPFLYSNDKPTVAVLDFGVNNVSQSDMKSITEFITVSFFSVTKIDEKCFQQSTSASKITASSAAGHYFQRVKSGR